jgi:hypothetical protein
LFSDVAQFRRIVQTNGQRKKNITGDDVMCVIHFAEHPTKTILEGGFKALFGVDWKEWDGADVQIKKKLLNKGILS